MCTCLWCLRRFLAKKREDDNVKPKKKKKTRAGGAGGGGGGKGGIESGEKGGIDLKVRYKNHYFLKIFKVCIDFLRL